MFDNRKGSALSVSQESGPLWTAGPLFSGSSVAYLAAWGAIFVPLAALLIAHGYEGSFLWLNALGFPALDAAAKWLTHLGDSTVAGAILAAVFWRRAPQVVLAGLLALAVSGVAAQLLKTFLFADWQRPLAVFDGQESFRYVLSYEMRKHSFPSGHATSCAAAGWALARGCGKRWQGAALAACAWVAALTRVYLGVHFVGDVLAGMALGTLSAVWITWLTEERLRGWVSRWPARVRRVVGWGLYGAGVVAIGIVVVVYGRG